VAATAILAGLTVLSHNITVAVFGVAFIAAAAMFVLGWVPSRLLIRSGAALAVSLLLYVAYIRPLVAGWHSTGNPTPVLVSYAAHLGIPTLALAFLGGALALIDRGDRRHMAWWLLMVAGGFCVFLLADFNFNPRYFVFFFPPAWILAAHGMAVVARRIGHRAHGAVWYTSVALLLLPGLLSHYQDGSRHDYRGAAATVVDRARPGEPILSDDAETISYYLPADLRRRLFVRTKVTEPPSSSFLLVARSNAWMPQPSYHGRRLDLLSEISHRRFDQFSHILRVYRVGPAGSGR